jgi:dephospho-CoA kinase
MKDLFIELDVDKEPYVKVISEDKIINLTGESGSGKSTYSQQFINDDNYIVLDTDLINKGFDKATGENKRFGEYLRSKYDILPHDCEEFDVLYKEMLEFYKDTDKTLVIDSAQFRNIKDISLLKGKVIVIRTCINTCYERCISRWKRRNENYTEDELNKFMERKKGMYSWYLSLNKFIEKVDNI